MRQRRVKRSNRQPRFLWQGVFILAPVFVLAALGTFAISQDRQMTQRQAEVRAEELAERNAAAVVDAFLRDPYIDELTALNDQAARARTNLFALYADVLITRVAGDSPGNRIYTRPSGLLLVLNADGSLKFPSQFDAIPEPRRLTGQIRPPKQDSLWSDARDAQDPSASIGLYDELLATGLPPCEEQQARAELAQALAREGNGRFILVARDLIAATNICLTDSGIELQAVAAALLAQHAPDTEVAFAASNAVRRPTSLTSAILEVLSARGATNEEIRRIADDWTTQWRRDCIIRMLYTTALPHFRTNGGFHLASVGALNDRSAASNLSIAPPKLFSLPPRLTTNTTWSDLISHDFTRPAFVTRFDAPGGSYLLCRSWHQAMNIVEGALQRTDGMDFTVQIGAHDVRGLQHLESLALRSAGRGGGQVLQRVWSIMPERLATVQRVIDGTAVVVTAYFVAPEVFFQQQKDRAAVFRAVIIAATMAALLGFISAYRAFHKQLRLAELKSNFVASVSHELRAPIASVRLLAEGLERGKVVEPDKQKEYFRFITQECRRLSSMIENVLDFARIDQGRKQYEFEPTDLRALVEQTVKLMEPYAAERGVTLVSSVDGRMANSENLTTNPPPFVANLDGAAVQQALLNLIDNAIKHSPSGNEVAVSLSINHPLSTINLSVSDRGPGIPPHEHEKIFERFYRLGSELRRETPGVGIGLSIVKHIVEAHGGHVRVESEVGNGTRFTIEIPSTAEAQRRRGAEKNHETRTLCACASPR